MTGREWYVDGQFDADTTVEVRERDNPNDVVCEIAPAAGNWTEPEIARVRLIAAAPELLEAVKALLAVFPTGAVEERASALAVVRNAVTDR